MNLKEYDESNDLSDYERLRLENIRKNQEFLAQLGECYNSRLRKSLIYAYAMNLILHILKCQYINSICRIK